MAPRCISRRHRQMAGLPNVPDDYEEGGARDNNSDSSDPAGELGRLGQIDPVQGAARVDELPHQVGIDQGDAQNEDGGRAIVGRVLRASRSVIDRVMGADPGVRRDQAVLIQAGQQEPAEDGIDFESADDAACREAASSGGCRNHQDGKADG